MQLHLSEPAYTDRLATFLTDLGQTVSIAAPGTVEIELTPTSSALAELRIYLRVWSVLYPETDVHVVNGDDEEPADVA